MYGQWRLIDILIAYVLLPVILIAVLVGVARRNRHH